MKNYCYEETVFDNYDACNDGCSISLNACGGNGDDDEIGGAGGGSNTATLKELKGNWTTVSISYLTT